MKVFIPWLHWLSKLDIFSCINNIWNFSLVIISCWFLKRTIEILITVTILSALLFVFEWKSWNSISVCVYVYASMCECIFYKILKAVANVWYFSIQKWNGFLYKGQKVNSSSWPGEVPNAHEMHLTHIFRLWFLSQAFASEVQSPLLIWEEQPVFGYQLLLECMMCCVIYFKSNILGALNKC